MVGFAGVFADFCERIFGVFGAGGMVGRDAINRRDAETQRGEWGEGKGPKRPKGAPWQDKEFLRAGAEGRTVRGRTRL